MADHTPGPWHVCGDMIRSTVSNAAMRSVAKVYVSQMHGKPEAAANARLIASAPDLLAVLKRVLGNTERAEDECRLDGFGYCYTHTSAFPCLVEQMRAAIAKAEGRDFPPQKEEE